MTLYGFIGSIIEEVALLNTFAIGEIIVNCARQALPAAATGTRTLT